MLKTINNSRFKDIRQIDDMNLIIDWDLRHQMAFIFEIDTEIVRSIIPKETKLQPYEIRPGVSAVFMGYNDYNPGNIIYGEAQPAFIEITRVFMVQPNLSLSMPIPRFTFYMHQIASNNPAFVKQEIEVLHLQSYYSPTMMAESNETKTDILISDEKGTIRKLINTDPNPTYREDSFFGQYYSMQDGKLYFGVFYWAGKVCVHQKKGKAGGDLNHPYLTDLKKTFDAGELGDSYMQLITSFGQPLVQRFYQPRLIREF